MAELKPFLNPGQRAQLKSERGLVVLGVELKDAREEIFVRMVVDGIAIGIAFVRAGFKSSHQHAAFNLFHLPRVQERAAAILEARRSTGVVTLPEVTDMLKRVFSNAYTEGEYSAAHNAAFSLARLYGHVTDRATVELIRRPSRDPDAPAEQALSSWVDALPGLDGPGLTASQEARFLRVSDAPAAPLGEQSISPSNINDLSNQGPRPEGPGPQGPDWLNDINGLASGMAVPGRPENGAPTRPVTGTPNECAQSSLLGGAQSSLLGPEPSTGTRPIKQRKVPRRRKRVPVTTGEKRAKILKRRVKLPSAEDLF